jgi:16S rRNA (guanine527-N7)-methyltransferase
MTQAELLAAGIAKIGLDVTSEQQQKLLQYLSLLHKWNEVYNLTAVRKPLEMVTLHLLDSLSVLPHIKSKNLLDVGSGGGLPGIVLAICLPTLQVTTIDTVQKKTIFMRQVKGELGLENLTVVHARVESFRPAEQFEAIISRAFSEIALFIKLTQHLIAKNGRWLAMKGAVPHHEFECSEFEDLGIKPSKIISLKVPSLQAERHLVVFENN